MKKKETTKGEGGFKCPSMPEKKGGTGDMGGSKKGACGRIREDMDKVSNCGW